MEIDKKEWKSRFAINLQVIMTDRGFNQRELADALGLNESTISRYLSGRITPTGIIISKIAKVLRCDISDLI